MEIFVWKFSLVVKCAGKRYPSKCSDAWTFFCLSSCAFFSPDSFNCVVMKWNISVICTFILTFLYHSPLSNVFLKELIGEARSNTVFQCNKSTEFLNLHDNEVMGGKNASFKYMRPFSRMRWNKCGTTLSFLSFNQTCWRGLSSQVDKAFLPKSWWTQFSQGS